MTEHRRATYDATAALFEALLGGGVRDVVLSPGSRSTPLAVTASMMDGLAIHVVLDERSAGFTALGMAAVSGRPVALVATSGSATANYLPAVVEANRGRVPMVVLTADRPEGFLERDAPQTIDQVGLYGVQVRSSVSLPTAHQADPTDVALLVRAAVNATLPPDAGPVHVNCPFDKPLEPESGWEPRLSEGSTRTTASPPVADETEVDRLREATAASRRGIVVAGPRRADDAELAAIATLGLPIVADPLSGHRRSPGELVISGGELMFRSPDLVDRLRPDLVVRTGGTPTGRGTQAWIEGLDVPVVRLDPDLRWTAAGSDIVARSDARSVATALGPVAVDETWVGRWKAAQSEVDARRALERADHPESEVSIAAGVVDAAPAVVWAASSMPVRHLDVMVPSGTDVAIHANRGANGIDGTIASAAGAALASGERATLLIGDQAFLHDIGSLKTALDLAVDLTIVVLDNHGGAIFSMLPVADQPGVDFARLFTTDHGTDLVALAAGFGATARRVTDPAGEIPSAEGVTVLVADCDPSDTHAAYRRLVPGGG